MKRGGGRQMKHVTAEIARDFLTCRLPRKENRLVVRHLLGQCPACLKLLHSLDPLHLTRSVGRESPRRPVEIPAALSSAVDRFFQGLEAAGAEATAKILSMDPNRNVSRNRFAVE